MCIRSNRFPKCRLPGRLIRCVFRRSHSKNRKCDECQGHVNEEHPGPPSDPQKIRLNSGPNAVVTTLLAVHTPIALPAPCWRHDCCDHGETSRNHEVLKSREALVRQSASACSVPDRT